MGLKSDVTELTSVWRSSPWRVKIFLLLSGFLATSSVASLSETIVKWKGFLLAGLSFYHDYIRNPVAHFIHNLFQVDISRGYIDSLLLYFLMVGALTRGLVIDMRIDKSRSNAVISIAGIALLVGILFLNIYHAVAADPGTRPTLLALYVGYIALVFIMLLPPRRAWSMLVLVYLFIPPLLVCIAAAINLGLK